MNSYLRVHGCVPVLVYTDGCRVVCFAGTPPATIIEAAAESATPATIGNSSNSSRMACLTRRRKSRSRSRRPKFEQDATPKQQQKRQRQHQHGLVLTRVRTRCTCWAGCTDTTVSLTERRRRDLKYGYRHGHSKAPTPAPAPAHAHAGAQSQSQGEVEGEGGCSSGYALLADANRGGHHAAEAGVAVSAAEAEARSAAREQPEQLRVHHDIGGWVNRAVIRRLVFNIIVDDVDVAEDERGNVSGKERKIEEMQSSSSSLQSGARP